MLPSSPSDTAVLALDSQAPVHRLLTAQARRTPHAIAVVDATAELTYAELDARSAAVAAALVAAGAGPSDPVGVCLPRGVDLVVALVAVLRAGAGYLPLDPAYPADRVQLILDDSRTPLVLTDERHRGVLATSAARPVLLADAARFLDNRPNGFAEPPVTIDDRCYVIYTSGSTGRPKGVDLTHRGVNAMLRWAAGTYRPSDLAGVLFATSVCFDISLFEVFFPLAVGGTVIVAENALALPEHPRRDDVTLINTVPSAMGALLRGPGLPDSVRVVNLAGEPLPRKLADRVHAQPHVRELYNLYGPTEDTVYSTWALVDRDSTDEPTIGVPLPGSTGHVLDEARRPVPDGGIGELFLSGDGLARGYLHRPDLTAERFVEVDGVRMYRTGDLVRRLPGGQLEYHGRTDHQVKVRGFRVELGEIEAVLGRFPGAQLTGAVARDDEAGRYLAGFVQASDPAVTPQALREHCAKALPGYMVPSAIAVLPALPLTPNGKVDRKALPAIERQRDDSTALVEPRTDVERSIAGVWREVLGLDRVGVHDVFLDLGGHSLLASAVLARVERAHGVRVGVAEFFAAPTIAALAARVAATDATEPAIVPARDPRAPLAVGQLQRDFWVGERMHGGASTLFNVALRIRVDGDLDADRLARALTLVVARNEVLRTGLAAVDGEPRPFVLPAADVPLPVVDVDPSIDGALDAALRAEAAVPMDLATGVLLRALLVRLTGPDGAPAATDRARPRHELLVTVHHAAFDGWSTSLLLDQLGVAYATGDLPEPALQFSDVARWEQKLLDAERPRLRAFWDATLRGAAAQQDLPGDRPDPAEADTTGDRVDRRVDTGLLAAAQRLATAEGTSLYTVLLAALGALTHRYTGRRDQVVVTPLALRPHPELESVIGPLLSTTAVRFDVDGAASLRDLVRSLRPTVLDAIEHGAAPFADLANAAEAPRDLSTTAVSQILLAVQNHPVSSVRLPGLDLDFVQEVSAGVSRLPLSLFLEFPVDGPLLTAEFQTAKYDVESVEALVDHWLAVLAAGVADPDAPVSRLAMLRADEVAALTEGVDTRAPYPQRTLPELVSVSALAHPKRVAVSCARHALTYADLDDQSNRLAHHLIALGAGPGRPVAVALPRTSRLLVALLAVAKTGAPYLPIDLDHPPARTAFVLDDAGVELVVTDSAVGHDLPGTRVEVDVVDLSTFPAGPPARHVDPASPAYVLYTSGSTGRPKGVVVPHRALVNFLTSMAREPGIETRDVVAAVTTLTFDIAGLELWLPLLAGARVAIADRETAADGIALARWLGAEKVTLLQATPATWRMLLAGNWAGRPDLAALCGGEALPVELARDVLGRVRALWNVYGPTETTIWSTIRRVDEAALAAAAPAAGGNGVIDLGTPIANTRVYVLDAAGNVVPPNAIGELCVAGDGLADGYLGRDELTAERFVADPYDAGRRVYRTGDLARRRRDGSLEFRGRADHQVKLRGHRIELGEIEAVLAAVPGVAAAVAGVRDERLVAWVVTTDGSGADGLADALRRDLPDYLVPTVFVLVDALPLTPNGKIDRSALPSPDAMTTPVAEFEEPRGDCEEILAQVWLDVLGLQRVDRRDNFFALGGHSLQATRMLARVRDQFEIELPVRAIFEAPTLAGLAARIEKTLLAELELVGEN